MPFALLLAMQAAGMVVDYMGTKQQAMWGEYGAKIQQAGIEANIEQTRLETEDASLQALQNLRKNMGTQLAIFAARGTQPGAGSAFSLLNENIGNFNADERTRRMNLLGRENMLKAGGSIAKLNQQGEKSRLWQGFSQRTVNRIPLGSLSSSGDSSNSFSGSRATGYGLTQMGGT